MNSMPGVGPAGSDAQRVTPARLWYWVAGGLVLAGVLGALLLVLRAVSDPPGPTTEMFAFQADTVELAEEGLTVYASGGSYRGDCLVRDGAGQRVPVEAPAGREHVTVGGRQWIVVARTAEEVPPGTYVVTCESDDDSTVFGVGPYVSFLGTAVAIFVAVGVAGVAFILGGVLALVVYLRRRSALQRLAQDYGR